MRGVSRSTAPGSEASSCVRDVSLSIQTKTLNLLCGDAQSGAGLLLRLLGLLDAPDKGGIFFRDEEMAALAEDFRAELRTRHFGFLFAQPFLLPSFSVAENVAMPLFKLSDAGPDEAQRRTEGMLAFTGMGNFAESSVGDLTIVQQHRVSLARALVNQPEILIIEDVDAEMAGDGLASFLETIRRASTEFGTTVILTARERELARFTDRIIEVADGVICRDSQTALKDGGATV